MTGLAIEELAADVALAGSVPVWLWHSGGPWPLVRIEPEGACDGVLLLPGREARRAMNSTTLSCWLGMLRPSVPVLIGGRVPVVVRSVAIVDRVELGWRLTTRPRPVIAWGGPAVLLGP